MKKYLFICCIALSACGPREDKSQSNADEQTLYDSLDIASTELSPASLYVWQVTSDQTKIHNANAAPAILHTDSILKGLNARYENVVMIRVRQSADTLYTAIPDSKYLASQMGSTGAEVYIADAVLNLTSVPGVKYVNVAMEEGDHAQPGTWSAENFKNYKEVTTP